MNTIWMRQGWTRDDCRKSAVSFFYNFRNKQCHFFSSLYIDQHVLVKSHFPHPAHVATRCANFRSDSSRRAADRSVFKKARGAFLVKLQWPLCRRRCPVNIFRLTANAHWIYFLTDSAAIYNIYLCVYVWNGDQETTTDESRWPSCTRHFLHPVLPRSSPL